MKRFATHRVYSLLTAEVKCSQILELDENGAVSKLYPFMEEVCGTEWLPGLIVLSPFPIHRKTGECFADFKKRMQDYTLASSPLRAYWVHPFNVSAMEFLENSCIISLK